MSKNKCYFSSDISETLSCCKDGKFDHLGFPVNQCKEYPCYKYKFLVEEEATRILKHRIAELEAEVSYMDALTRAKIEAEAMWADLEDKLKVAESSIDSLRNALTLAKQHLDYCGYGDAWERECAEASNLSEVIDNALDLKQEDRKC